MPGRGLREWRYRLAQRIGQQEYQLLASDGLAAVVLAELKVAEALRPADGG
jgi:predicted Fe-Mo cluster-binding NifX family protein